MPLGIVSLLPMILLAVAGPAVIARLPRGAPRRIAAAGAAALFLAHFGLYILFSSRLLCWLAVGAAAVVATAGAFPRSRPAVAVAGAAALALGLAFQLTPGDVGILVYVGGAAPALLGVSLAALASRSLAGDASGPVRFAAATMGLFAGLVPFTSFYPAFLLAFEPMHLAPLALALAGLAMLASAARPARVETWGEVSARARDTLRTARSALLAACFVAAGAALAGIPGAPDAILVALAAVGLLVAATLTAGAGPRRLALLSLATLGLATLVAAQAALDIHLRGGAGAMPAGRLFASSLAAATATATLALALGRARDDHARERALAAPPAIPQDALVEEGTGTPEEVRALAARLAPGQRGILRVRAPSDAPYWTVSDATYAALLAARGVHAAIVEAGETTLVPPIAEVEGV